jgi:hypothetical protein
MTKQIQVFAFFWCFIRELNLWTVVPNKALSLSLCLSLYIYPLSSLSPTRANSNPIKRFIGYDVMCVCLLLQDLLQSCARGGRRIVEDMCYEIRRAEACVD